MLLEEATGALCACNYVWPITGTALHTQPTRGIQIPSAIVSHTELPYVQQRSVTLSPTFLYCELPPLRGDMAIGVNLYFFTDLGEN